MNILVCIKQVPLSNQVEVDPVTGVLKREGAGAKLNPYDLFALEQAFSLRDRLGGSVSVITMGPLQAKTALLEALSMGADRGFLLSDRAFAGSDVLATSYTLSLGIRMAGEFDLILCGKQTTDGDTAQVGPEMAEHLGIAHAANVSEVLGADALSITVRLQFETLTQTQRMRLPCLVTVDKDINTPRLPSYLRQKAITPDRLHVISAADLENADRVRFGLSGSPTQVEKIFPPEKKSGQTLLSGSGEELADRLFSILKREKYL